MGSLVDCPERSVLQSSMVKGFGATGIVCGLVASFSAFACDPRCSDGFGEQDHCEQQPPTTQPLPGMIGRAA